jgi:hypothetical protein
VSQLVEYARTAVGPASVKFLIAQAVAQGKDPAEARAQLTNLRDQASAGVRDAIAQEGLEPGDPRVLQGALAGLLIAERQARMDGFDLLSVPPFAGLLDALCVLVAQNASTGE